MIQLKIIKRGVKDFSFIENFLQEKLQGETVKTVTISENVYDKICCRYGRILKHYIDRYKIEENLFFCNENYSFEVESRIYGKYGYFYKMKIIDNKKYAAERFFERIDLIRERNEFFYDEEIERMYCKAVRMQEEDLFNPFQINFVEGQLKRTKKMDEIRSKINDLFDKIEDRMDHLKERKARLRAESEKEEAERKQDIADSKAKEDLKSITFNAETTEIENQKQDLKNPEKLYQFIKDTFFDAVNKLRSDNSYKAFRKFVNTYLQEININHIRIEHLSINGFKKILTECKTLKEFKKVIALIGKEYGSKCVVDTYTNMLDDLKTFQEDGDLEEVEEIKQQLQTCIKLTDNLILY